MYVYGYVQMAVFLYKDRIKRSGCHKIKMVPLLTFAPQLGGIFLHKITVIIRRMKLYCFCWLCNVQLYFTIFVKKIEHCVWQKKSCGSILIETSVIFKKSLKFLGFFLNKTHILRESIGISLLQSSGYSDCRPYIVVLYILGIGLGYLKDCLSPTPIQPDRVCALNIPSIK